MSFSLLSLVLGIFELAIIGAVCVSFCVFAIFGFFVLKPWLKCFMANGGVSLFHIIGMRLRGSNVNLVIDTHLSYIMRGDRKPISSLEACYIAHKHQVFDVASLQAKFT